MDYSYFESAIGPLLLTGDRQGLHGLYFSTGKKARGADPDWSRCDDTFRRVRKQLTEYFDGRRTVFELDLVPHGTDFQCAVWQALRGIPYGEMVSYKDIAQEVGRPRAVRAVGTANGSNPIAIIVPCHRVVGSNGSLTGFGGGLDAKRFLLDLEARHSGLFGAQVTSS